MTTKCDDTRFELNATKFAVAFNELTELSVNFIYIEVYKVGEADSKLESGLTDNHNCVDSKTK